ncbi:hypothetical protein ACH4S8_37770 [Streptomyces sp. NPDC021080]|uniref:hypothetical protein n=1 Tax=Streptomyces sp. NPDC021080 TaxID=3365110 RepID=UPI00379AE961
MGIQPDIPQRLTHQTLGMQRLAVHAEDYWEYKPDQRVQTTDGLPGTVKAVLDGPYPGSEEYQVELDRGMGGGAYTASQLRPAAATTAAMEQTAAADYPELSQILVERPDPAGMMVYAGKNPFADTDGDDDSDDGDDGSNSDDGSDEKDDDKDSDSDDGDDSEDDDSDGDDSTPPWVKKDASALFASMVVTAAADKDFRFQITAAWKDVVAKAKRIRAEGGVRVTMASDGLVFAEVKGDSEVYEAGLQRLPNKQAIHSWSCGCKWGAYHWGADDDFSKFAGRMCSHALALQYEAQSRGMFGRNVGVDETRPHWVPRKVVVKYDIDSGQNRLAPSTAAHAGPALAFVARAAVAAGENAQEMLFALGSAGIRPLADAAAPFGSPSGTSYQLPKAPGATSPKLPWENPVSAGPLAGADPVGWNRQLPLESYASLDAQHSLFEPGGAEAELHDQPEGALPATDGVQIPSNDEALSPSITGSLRRQALKDFTLAERQALIDEGEGVRAANLDLLKIEGTHYADLESILAAQEDDTTWLA